MVFDSDLLSFRDELRLDEAIETGESNMSRIDDKVCVIHDVVERQIERDRDETRKNFEEAFSRIRMLEKQIWWFGGAVAMLILLGDLLPKIFKAMGK